MFLFSRPQSFLTSEEASRIVSSIRNAEKQTSGEIRVFIESRCRFVNPVDRAREVFFDLKMDKTKDHNGVVLYVAVKDRQLAIFGDWGIHKRLGNNYWLTAVQKIITLFKESQYAEGIEKCIIAIGETLKIQFPYTEQDKNELPDDIVFGK